MQIPEVQNLSEVKHVDKVWGYEKWLVNTSYCCKILFLKKGHACSYHFHREKDETFFVLDGSANVLVSWQDDEDKAEVREISKGDILHVPTGMRHRIVPKEDLTLIEVSTHHEDSDSIRINQGY